MSVKAKYQPVLDLGEKFNIKDGYVNEEAGKLKIGGVAATPYEKDQLWDAIKKAAGSDMPSDIEADIKVSDTSIYTKHTVEKGESLSLIAKKYFRDPMKYKQIFEANTDKLKNPDLIQPGLILTIPNLA